MTYRLSAQRGARIPISWEEHQHCDYPTVCALPTQGMALDAHESAQLTHPDVLAFL